MGQIVLLLSLLSATGAQWLALQAVAWSAMLVDYTRHAPWTEAVAQTFDGKHPCALCKTIERGRGVEKKAEVGVVVTKLDWFHEPPAAWIMPRSEEGGWVELKLAGELRFEQPPLPPPRVA